MYKCLLLFVLCNNFAHTSVKMYIFMLLDFIYRMLNFTARRSYLLFGLWKARLIKLGSKIKYGPILYLVYILVLSKIRHQKNVFHITIINSLRGKNYCFHL